MTRTATVLAVQEHASSEDVLVSYLDMLAHVERLHRLLLDVIKDEFERLERFDLNSVQALLLFNIGDKTVSAGELKTRGYYQGSNVSYNLKKLVEGGFIHHQRSDLDRRSVRVCLTPKGQEVHAIIAELFRNHAAELGERLQHDIEDVNDDLRAVERFWSEKIRYMY